MADTCSRKTQDAKKQQRNCHAWAVLGQRLLRRSVPANLTVNSHVRKRNRSNRIDMVRRGNVLRLTLQKKIPLSNITIFVRRGSESRRCFYQTRAPKPAKTRRDRNAIHDADDSKGL
jgi:hypothetical protein